MWTHRWVQIGIVSQIEKKDPDALAFFEEEYRLNHLIATLRTPFVALMNGYTMGGGVGLSIHAPFRVATEKTIFAMPEVSIGLIPDVGGTFFLSRLDGETGTYLALTGEQLAKEDVLYAGLATHYVPAQRLPALEERLNELESDDLSVVNMAIEEFSAEPSKKRYSLGPHRAAIDRCFKYDTVEEIIEALKAEGTAWANKTVETLQKKSPTSLKVTLRQLRIGRNLNLINAFKLEFNLVQRLIASHDFTEGVKAVLMEKRDPVWSPASLSDVSDEEIRANYFDTPAPRELELLSTQDYVAYPYVKHTLPTEQDVYQAVSGQRVSSSSVRPTKEEVVSMLLHEWQNRTFVREHVEEIIDRCCVPDKDGFLTWKPGSNTSN
jgi:3-hydroxyisobutyryl-CoA hydrolase